MMASVEETTFTLVCIFPMELTMQPAKNEKLTVGETNQT